MKRLWMQSVNAWRDAAVDVSVVPTNDKRVDKDSRNREATNKLKSDVNIDVWWEASTDTEQEQEEEWQKNHKPSAKPEDREADVLHCVQFRFINQCSIDL